MPPPFGDPLSSPLHLALTALHSLSYPFARKPQALPAARVLVQLAKGLGTSSAGRNGLVGVAWTGRGRERQGVMALLGRRQFSAGVVRGARVVRGEGWEWATGAAAQSRSRFPSQEQEQEQGKEKEGEGTRTDNAWCLRRMLFGYLERGGGGWAKGGERVGSGAAWSGLKGWWMTENVSGKWPSWLRPSSSPFSSSSSKNKTPLPPRPQDFRTRTSPPPGHSGPCHPYHLAPVTSSRAYWSSSTAAKEPVQWLVKRLRRKPDKWTASASATNSHAYLDGVEYHHGFGHSHGQKGVQHEHDDGDWVDLPGEESSSSTSSSSSHSHSSSSSHHRKPPDDFSSSNHSSQPPPPPSDECTARLHWLFAIPLNERRRRDPQKRRHFKHMMHTMGIHRTMWISVVRQGCEQAERECGSREGRGGGAWRWRCFRRRVNAHRALRSCRAREMVQRCRDEFLRRKAGAVLRFREAARQSGGAGASSSSDYFTPSSPSSSCNHHSSPCFSKSDSSNSHSNTHHQHSTSSHSRSGPFNYQSFRESLWFSRMHYRPFARLHNSNAKSSFGIGGIGGGGGRRPRFRHVAPEAWIRGSHARKRGKNGVAFFTIKYSNARPLRGCGSVVAGAEEGALGGSRVALGKPPAKVEASGAGVVQPCHLYRNELTARLASSAAARIGGVSLLSSTSSTIASSRLSAAAAAVRTFSTTPSRPSLLLSSAPATLLFSPLHLSLPFLLPLASVLKSTAALNLLTLLTRLSLTLLPLSVRGKVWHVFREKYAADPNSVLNSAVGRAWVDRVRPDLAAAAAAGATRSAGGGVLARWNAAVGLPVLLAAPFVLLGLVVAASLERTPVTGRWRVVMLSPAEEAELVDGILAPPPSSSSSTAAVIPEGTSRDWVSILHSVLSLPDEGLSPTTGRRILLGGEVLDQRDWRVRWAEAVLRALEKGGQLALVGGGGGGEGGGGVPAGVMVPPPTAYPLEPRLEHAGAWKDELMLAKHLSTTTAAAAAAEPASPSSSSLPAAGSAPPLRVEYDLLVVDRPDANAFSFGFGPDRASDGARRGVVVVYTGFLDEILGTSPASSLSSASLPPTPPPSPPSPARSSLFPSFTTPTPTPSPPSPAPATVDPIQANLVPSILPTQAQTKALAVLLSHELAHLCLDHTLESYASTGLVVPHLMRLGSDVLRTLLYPLTFFLGPFLNDALGRTLHEGALGGFGVIGQAVNSCESRKLESEADRVALRLLAGSGIDPSFAVEFWEDRLASAAHTPSSSPSSSPVHSHSPLPTLPGIRQHSHSHNSHSSAAAQSRENARALDGLLRSHPVEEERVVVIKKELEGWKRWWDAHGGIPAAAGAAATA